MRFEWAILLLKKMIIDREFDIAKFVSQTQMDSSAYRQFMSELIVLKAELAELEKLNGEGRS